ncbi:hypothetical protein GKQ38_03180 [Candidatus Nanohaloarchaea archaeon]|nr:hypothetical protein GKQ38_03180 [Candidatus Nanohaloarchaea archaeon]
MVRENLEKLHDKVLYNRPLGEFLVLTGFLSFVALFAYLGYRVSTGIYNYRPGEYQLFAGLMVASFAFFVAGAEILLIDWRHRH